MAAVVIIVVCLVVIGCFIALTDPPPKPPRF